MKTSIILLICAFMLSCTDNPVGPEEETYTPPPKNAKIEMSGSLEYTYTSYFKPSIKGTVINNGNATGYNTGVTFTAKSGSIIVDTAIGFPASLGDIKVGESATFEAVFFNLNLHSDYDSVTFIIEYLTKK